MSAPPNSVIKATTEEEATIRAAVRNANTSKINPASVRATRAHVAALVDLLSDPRVSSPIYDLPHPISSETVADWVKTRR